MTAQERADRFEAQSFLELYRKAARRLRSPRGLMVWLDCELAWRGINVHRFGPIVWVG